LLSIDLNLEVKPIIKTKAYIKVLSLTGSDYDKWKLISKYIKNYDPRVRFVVFATFGVSIFSPCFFISSFIHILLAAISFHTFFFLLSTYSNSPQIHRNTLMPK
jgi:hypothetical protein